MPSYPFPLDHPAVHEPNLEGVVYKGELAELPAEVVTRLRLGDPSLGIVYAHLSEAPSWTLCELISESATTLTLRALSALEPNYPFSGGDEFTLWMIDAGPGQIWLDPRVDETATP